MIAALLFFALIGLEILAVVFAFRAIGSARTAQGSIGWVVFLISAPFIAVPMYLVFGHSRYVGYVNARHDAAETVANLLNPSALPPHGQIATTPDSHAFERIAGVPATAGNGFELLIDGEAAFSAMFDAIDAAQSYLLVQFYIFRDDEIGRELKRRLIDKARAGVSVRVLYDRIGCVGLARSYIDDLLEAGVDIRDVHAMRARANRFQINFRNHRKVLIADGTVGFLGGLNVGDEYLGRSERYGPWRDTHCRIEGPVVAQLQIVFCEDWFWASKDILLDEMNWTPGVSEEARDALLVAMGPGDDFESGTLYFINAIVAARERVWIATPYFVPETEVLTALKLAALRGVEVRVLVPEVIDHYLPWLAAFAYFDEVRAAGVQIWRYQDGFMHQKVLVIDDEIASVGTVNLDNRSCRLNFEVTAIFFDEGAAQQTTRMLEADFARSKRLTKPLSEQNWRKRFGAPFARLFAPAL